MLMAKVMKGELIEVLHSFQKIKSQDQMVGNRVLPVLSRTSGK